MIVVPVARVLDRVLTAPMRAPLKQAKLDRSVDQFVVEECTDVAAKLCIPFGGRRGGICSALCRDGGVSERNHHASSPSIPSSSGLGLTSTGSGSTAGVTSVIFSAFSASSAAIQRSTMSSITL